MRAQLGQPSGIADICLTAGQVLHVPGVDQHQLKPGVLEQVVELLPVVAGGLHHRQGDPLRDQVLAQRQDLVRHRTPRGDRLLGSPAALPGDPDTDLRVSLGDVQTGTAVMNDFHDEYLPFPTTDVRRGEGREIQESDARARRQQSTVPVEPSATMLTYRLTGTTEASASTATNSSFSPARAPLTRPPPSRTQHESSRTTVRLHPKALGC
jgi:hypothetical protein